MTTDISKEFRIRDVCLHEEGFVKVPPPYSFAAAHITNAFKVKNPDANLCGVSEIIFLNPDTLQYYSKTEKKYSVNPIYVINVKFANGVVSTLVVERTDGVMVLASCFIAKGSEDMTKIEVVRKGMGGDVVRGCKEVIVEVLEAGSKINFL